MNSAASSSELPISPIMMIEWVSGSQEHLEDVDRNQCPDRVAADADGRGLAEVGSIGRLEHRFIGERAGA